MGEYDGFGGRRDDSPRTPPDGSWQYIYCSRSDGRGPGRHSGSPVECEDYSCHPPPVPRMMTSRTVTPPPYAAFCRGSACQGTSSGLHYLSRPLLLPSHHLCFVPLNSVAFSSEPSRRGVVSGSCLVTSQLGPHLVEGRVA